jgi:hypothetical protein
MQDTLSPGKGDIQDTSGNPPARRASSGLVVQPRQAVADPAELCWLLTSST